MPKYVKFSEPYDISKFLEFLSREFLTDSFVLNIEEIALKNNSRIKKAFELGEDLALGITVFEFEHDSEKDPRVSLSREAFRIMADYGIRDALAIFKSSNSENYRFSYMSIELTKENGKIKNKYSNPKRYSFYLGPDAKIHTPEKFLSKRVIDLEDLRKRFSVEVVNKEFYEKIALLFTKLVGGKRKIGSEEKPFETIVKLPSTDPKKDHKILQEFAVRLIGRIIFVWFLKEKHSESGNPLVPKEVLSSQSVKEAIENNQDYYHEVIEPLFFEVLNTKLEERKERFRKPEFDQIPFLNGGLFAPHNHDYYEIDEITGFSKYLNTLKIPNEWLEELLGLLETYNFTIDENTPVDVELSVDPEMLGRIFENLLAEINPETGESARKATGSYYTPRSIVEYMVDESLKHYLVSRTGIAEKQAENLLSYADEELNLNEDEKEKVLDALSKLKIIDPACGSGAFPMGILQKMIWILEKIDPNAEKWKEKQLERLSSVPVLRNIMEKKLEGENTSYIRKLGIIENSIYGIDIQEIAVEISKLRIFLSLVVDANTNDDPDKNRGVKALPNLEFKFVCANSLIGLPKQLLAFGVDTKKIDRLKTLREKYFNSYGEEKANIQKQFEKTQKEIEADLLGWAIDNKNTIGVQGKAFSLSKWDPFGDEPSEWFDPEWMFGIKDGFDIVIANPPYVRQEKIKDLKPILKEQKYEVYSGTADLYTYFYELSYKLLKPGGISTFISSNKWMRAKYGEKLRKFFKEKTHLKQIIDFNGYKVFEATVDTNITIFVKPLDSHNTNLRVATIDNTFDKDTEIKSFFIKKAVEIKREDLDVNGYYFSSKEEMKLKKKIEEAGKPLKDWGITINYGIKTGFNKAFVIDTETKEKLCDEDPKSAEVLKPILRGRDLHRYYYEWKGLWLLFIPWHFPLHQNPSITGASSEAEAIFHETYPAIYKHLEKYKDQLLSRNKAETGIRYEWYALQRCAATYYQEFEEEKIFYPVISQNSAFCIDRDGYYHNDKAFSIVGVDLKYLLGLLNSKLCFWYLNKIGSCLGSKGFEFRKIYVERIPAVLADRGKKETIAKLALKIQTTKKGGILLSPEKIKKLDKTVDQIVYELYGLTNKEVDIIEKFFKDR